MPEIIDRRISFNGGEVSPWTDPRIDLEKYRNACRKLENMRPTIYGGAFNRSGTVYMGEAKFADRRCKLVEFEYSVTAALILEFGDQYIRFWFTGLFPGRVFDPITPANAYEIATPWDENEVFELQFAQQNDVVYITHPDHPVQMLTRLANNNWTLVPLNVEWPATLDENITATTLTASAVTGSSVTLTASTSIFNAGHVGSTWIIKHRREDPTVTVNINSVIGTFSDPLFVLGDWVCSTRVAEGGTWYVAGIVERSYDKVTWETVQPITSSGLSSDIISGTELDPCFLRVKIVKAVGTPPLYAYFELSASDPDHYGIVRFNSVASGTSANVNVLFELASTTATTRWQEAAWSSFRGYPRAVSFHQNRLFFAGSRARPQTVWGSIIDDYKNFRVTSDDDAGLSLTLAGLKANPIQWLVSQDTLLIGTAGAEGPVGSREADKSITPSNAKKGKFTNIGSAYIQAIPVNDAVIFINRSKRKAWEFVFAFESDGFKAADLTLLSEHITDGGIVHIAVQKNAESNLWAPLDTGKMIGIAYARDQNVAGWFNYTTGERVVDGDTTYDSFESVALVSGAGEDDEQWVSVQREINGETVRYIERFKPDITKDLKNDNQNVLVYVDCAGIYNGSPTTTITGADWLEGEEVSILADGAPCPRKTVVGGSFTIPAASSSIIYGRPYTAILEPTFLETNDPGSLSKVAKKLIKWADVELWKSLGMEFSGDGGKTFDKVEFRSDGDRMDEAPPLFSGIAQRCLMQSSSAKQRSVIIRQTQPLPLNVLSIHCSYELNNT